jgi:hypothetical protein
MLYCAEIILVIRSLPLSGAQACSALRCTRSESTASFHFHAQTSVRVSEEINAIGPIPIASDSPKLLDE